MPVSHESSLQSVSPPTTERPRETAVDPAIPLYALRYGLLTTALLIAYFLVAGWLDFRHLTDLRYFNIFFLMGGVFLALRRFYGDDATRYTNYFNGFLTGLGVAAVSGVTFSLFVYLFFGWIAPDMGLPVRAAMPFAGVTAGLMSLIVLVEALLSGVMVAFVAMQFFKNVR